MVKSILNQIERVDVKTGVENLTMYRLGVFENKMYELVELNSGQYCPPHIHKNSESKILIIKGSGEIILNGLSRPYALGSVFFVERGMIHGFKCKDQTLFLSIQTPPIIDTATGEIDIEYFNK